MAQFDKFIEALPHIFPIINKHSNEEKRRLYSAKVFEKLNNLVVSSASGKKRFEEIDKVFSRLGSSGSDLSDLLNLKPFLNIIHYLSKSTKEKILKIVLSG